MAKRCPLDDYKPVIYAACLECESKDVCRRGELNKQDNKTDNAEQNKEK